MDDQKVIQGWSGDGSSWANGRDAKIRELRRISLLSAVPACDLRRLAEQGRSRDYLPGAMIDPLGEEDMLGGVVAGSVRIMLVSRDRRELTLADRSTGEIIDAGVRESSEPEGTGDIVIGAGRKGATVRFFPIRDLFVAVTATREGPQELVRWLRGEARLRYEVIAELAFCSVRTRVAHTVARLAIQDGSHTVCETHHELAVRAGTRREEVTRALSDLRHRNLVESTGRGHIRVPDPGRLITDPDAGR